MTGLVRLIAYLPHLGLGRLLLGASLGFLLGSCGASGSAIYYRNLYRTSTPVTSSLTVSPGALVHPLTSPR